MSIRILLADDHHMVRAGLRSLLKHEPGVEVIAEAEDGRAAVRLAAELAPDVIVMDIGMPELNGVEATRQIRAGRNGDGPRVIILSAHPETQFAARALEAGAMGYLAKTTAFYELAEAIRSVMRDKAYFSAAAAGAVVDHVARDTARAGTGAWAGAGTWAGGNLSPREREILQLLAEGKAMKEIARDLSVSVKTVETHRKNLKEKLRLDSVAELTKYAVREGITAL